MKPALPARRPTGGTTRLAAVTVVAALLALCGWFGADLYAERQEEQRRQDILAAARQMTVNFTSLSHTTYQDDAKNVLRAATGDFKRQFGTQTEKLTELVAKNKSVTEGQVLEAGIVRSEADSARVLVVADSKVSNVALPEGETRNYRLQLDLVREDGRWLTSAIEFVG
jgi:Mce-associated membrane protein